MHQTVYQLSTSSTFVAPVIYAYFLRYAGMLLGITNTFGTIPGVLAPIVVGYLTKDVSCPFMHYISAVWSHFDMFFNVFSLALLRTALSYRMEACVLVVSRSERLRGNLFRHLWHWKDSELGEDRWGIRHRYTQLNIPVDQFRGILGLTYLGFILYSTHMLLVKSLYALHFVFHDLKKNTLYVSVIDIYKLYITMI